MAPMRGKAEGRGPEGRNSAGFDAERTALEIERELRDYGNPARAEQERRYLKSEREHIGVSVPRIRVVVSSFADDHPDLTRPQLLGLVERLWGRPIHECRMAAVELLERFGPLLVPSELPFLQRLIRESGTWAVADGLAASVTGPLVERHPELAASLDDWAGDPDFWVRRSALLALLLPLRRGEGDFDRFARYADEMLEEKEFFIRKAIGWVLREVGKKRPELVHEWLLPRASRASGLTVREAVKYLPEAMAERIMAVRAAPSERNGGQEREAEGPDRPSGAG